MKYAINRDGFDICPRCECIYDEAIAALSRRDNITRVCSRCGIAEALEDADLMPRWEGHMYWKLSQTPDEKEYDNGKGKSKGKDD